MKAKKKLTTKELFEKYEVPDDVVDSIFDEVEKEYDKELDDMNMSDMENMALFYRQQFGEKLMQRLLENKDSRIKERVKKKPKI